MFLFQRCAFVGEHVAQFLVGDEHGHTQRFVDAKYDCLGRRLVCHARPVGSQVHHLIEQLGDHISQCFVEPKRVQALLCQPEVVAFARHLV